jgi:osmotically-inducible protein OsmY
MVTTSTASYPPAPPRTASTDTTISQAVVELLQRDGQTGALPIGVNVFDRIVFVHGNVPSVGSIADLTAMIGRVDDVAEVIDELVIDERDIDPQEYMGPDTEEVIE